MRNESDDDDDDSTEYNLLVAIWQVASLTLAITTEHETKYFLDENEKMCRMI